MQACLSLRPHTEYGAPVRDQRVIVLRKALGGLVDSLDATVRKARWQGTEAIPEPLERSAANLDTRRTEAQRLIAAKVVGSGTVFTALTTMTQALRDLETAGAKYLDGNRDASAPDRADEDMALDAALERARESARAFE